MLSGFQLIFVADTKIIYSYNFVAPLEYEPRINDKELYDKEQKIHTNLFYIYVLKDFRLKLFHTFLTKGNSEDQAK